MESSTINKREVKFNDAGIEKMRRLYLSPFLFRFGMLGSLPLGFITGLKISKFDNDSCSVKAPYKYFNKNPFNTTYWAVLGMAAEMAGGVILLSYVKNISPSVATYVVGCESKFVNRALGVTTFTCNEGAKIKEEVRLAAETGEARTFVTSTNGYSDDGKLVAEFTFTWSVKARKN